MDHRFSANLSMLFTEVPLLERFEQAAKAGFTRVELQFPYEATAEAIAERLQAHGLKLVLHNLPAGDWAGGERGIACLTGREEEFRQGVSRGIAYATALGVPRLNVLSGIAPAGADEATLRQTFISNLRYAASACKAAGLELLMEPINRRDIPGFWLDTTTKALGLLDEIGADNLKLQFDLYHAQRSEGELAGTLTRHLARIGHIQFADNPGRHEPGTGEIRFSFLWQHLKALGYTGGIGAEYKPRGHTSDSMGWLDEAVRTLGA
jgi:hydroxypyruvate isomerase